MHTREQAESRRPWKLAVGVAGAAAFMGVTGFALSGGDGARDAVADRITLSDTQRITRETEAQSDIATFPVPIVGFADDSLSSPFDDSLGSSSIPGGTNSGDFASNSVTSNSINSLASGDSPDAVAPALAPIQPAPAPYVSADSIDSPEAVQPAPAPAQPVQPAPQPSYDASYDSGGYYGGSADSHGSAGSSFDS